MKRLALLGSTGSIGRSTLSVVDAHPDKLEVVALAAGENAAALAGQVEKYRPAVVGVATEAARAELVSRLGSHAPKTIVAGPEALVACATAPRADLVMCASSGTAGLEAALAAIAAGRTLALANKEVLVMAGAIMTDAARKKGVAILPVDSEHNAIHQCLHGRAASELKRLILTASGGPFRRLSADALARVTPEDALRHPTWQMGRKITIDSATLMNKGLEVIEARWLFGAGPNAIDVVIHPQSIVHSLVEFVDGSILAQLGVTDMRLPIQYACSYPDRWDGGLPRLDVAALGSLEFLPPDSVRFPCLGLAYEALEAGGAWPATLNAANEVAVEAFLAGQMRFTDIPVVIARTLEAARDGAVPATLADVRAVDARARAISTETLSTLRSS